MLGGGDQHKEQRSGANVPQAPADGDGACAPGMQGASGHEPLSATRHLREMEAMPLQAGAGGVQVASCVIQEVSVLALRYACNRLFLNRIGD